MIVTTAIEEVLKSVEASHLRGFELRMHAMLELDKFPNYDWSGIYRLEGNELVLDAYVGEHTNHTRIPVGRGVCGTAVAQNANQVIDDVRELDNYLSCSIKTRSEIVVLIRKGETVIGQIDIDGHTVNAFDASDEEMLEKLASLLADRWE